MCLRIGSVAAWLEVSRTGYSGMGRTSPGPGGWTTAHTRHLLWIAATSQASITLLLLLLLRGELSSFDSHFLAVSIRETGNPFLSSYLIMKPVATLVAAAACILVSKWLGIRICNAGS